jgi:hypothetical protein
VIFFLSLYVLDEFCSNETLYLLVLCRTIPYFLGNGQCLLRLLQFSGVLAGDSPAVSRALCSAWLPPCAYMLIAFYSVT